MLNIIYGSLGLATAILAVVYVILFIVSLIKKSDSNVSSIKVRIVLSSIMCALFIIEIITEIILEELSVFVIFCVILWAINIRIGFLSLKDAQNKTLDSEFHTSTNSGFREREDIIIDVEFIEVEDTDESKTS